MGCCSVTQRHSGTDQVGPEEMELLEIGNGGIWSLGETSHRVPLQNRSRHSADSSPQSPVSNGISDETLHEAVLWGQTREVLHSKIYNDLIDGWEGQAIHTYREIIWSSVAHLHNSHTQERSEIYLVLFSFHLLILAVDHAKRGFVYQGILPLSGMTIQEVKNSENISNMFEITAPMVEPKMVICTSPTERRVWVDNIRDRVQKSMTQHMVPFQSVLSCLMPFDEKWKKNELEKYLLHNPIWNWEGTPIQHLGHIHYISMVAVTNSNQEENQTRLLVLFPSELVILSFDFQRANIIYEGRLPLTSIQAVEKSAVPGRLEFEITGHMMEPMLVFCFSSEDYENWLFRLQQPEQIFSAITEQPPPLVPKKQKS
ncbi:protein polyglycylase TTLL10-like [Acipenser oxyrinchus oxyrinchus]|uniref:Protein polyglycylase TTLL10-like n=1 Tax=Acipenser oxyrinchus oxyrinchus TaxID=40147 RepID=A0AAD8FU01_ACIOX|nr:protein polyglycylase TTLL10-like [Acipenser oxyrinchus oxyrinchus]